jgi:hypothetical protein
MRESLQPLTSLSHYRRLTHKGRAMQIAQSGKEVATKVVEYLSLDSALDQKNAATP